MKWEHEERFKQYNQLYFGLFLIAAAIIAAFFYNLAGIGLGMVISGVAIHLFYKIRVIE